MDEFIRNIKEGTLIAIPGRVVPPVRPINILWEYHRSLGT
jgi:hypothetical protein